MQKVERFKEGGVGVRRLGEKEGSTVYRARRLSPING